MGILDKIRQWREKRKIAKQNSINRKTENSLQQEPGPKYSLIKQIKKAPYYGKSPSDNDANARKFIMDHVKSGGVGNIVPGQLILFEYFEPATREDLEYYDASPCTIFFNVVNTSHGKRVLGFNIH